MILSEVGLLQAHADLLWEVPDNSFSNSSPSVVTEKKCSGVQWGLKLYASIFQGWREHNLLIIRQYGLFHIIPKTVSCAVIFTPILQKQKWKIKDVNSLLEEFWIWTQVCILKKSVLLLFCHIAWKLNNIYTFIYLETMPREVIMHR